MKQNPPAFDIAVLLRAGDIPLRAQVTKRTGEKLYTLTDKIRIFDGKGTQKDVSADAGARFLVSSGDVNVVGADTLLLWRTTRENLLAHLQDEDLEIEDSFPFG